jgi:hypothetical protein
VIECRAQIPKSFAVSEACARAVWQKAIDARAAIAAEVIKRS